MAKKLEFYDRYGVEEYDRYDPDHRDLNGYQRVAGRLQVIEEISDWSSPRLGICWPLGPDQLDIYYPDGSRFLTTI